MAKNIFLKAMTTLLRDLCITRHFFVRQVERSEIPSPGKGENFNRRNTLGILRIALTLHFVHSLKPDAASRTRSEA
ncbi:MAG: hypothetical protein JRE23_10955 [Deltaproteobacteria bacterium]|nr:hypothetical protein [Deltaproteobacteria bacterium]